MQHWLSGSYMTMLKNNLKVSKDFPAAKRKANKQQQVHMEKRARSNDYTSEFNSLPSLQKHKQAIDIQRIVREANRKERLRHIQ